MIIQMTSIAHPVDIAPSGAPVITFSSAALALATEALAEKLATRELASLRAAWAARAARRGAL